MRRSLTLFLALVLLPAFAGCDSGDPTGTGPNGQACNDGTLTATVDGESFTAECVVIDITNGLLTFSGITNLDGSDGATQRQISFGGAQAQTGPQNPTVANYADIDASNPSNATVCAAVSLPGTPPPSLTIDAIDDDSASGSFSFSALCPSSGSNVQVTNGQFDISK